jgi:hypothetical protein
MRNGYRREIKRRGGVDEGKIRGGMKVGLENRYNRNYIFRNIGSKRNRIGGLEN